MIHGSFACLALVWKGRGTFERKMVEAVLREKMVEALLKKCGIHFVESQEWFGAINGLRF